MNTAIVLFIFRRPEATALVWEQIRQVKPPKLFIIADGARSGRTGEEKQVQEARRITEEVDWECEVVRDYSKENLGTHHRIATGLNRLFAEVEEAIILEDDCLPHPSFFRYCEELLERYRTNRQVMAISGFNITGDLTKAGESYLFSRNPSNCGWASWRRAWNNYDAELESWRDIRRREAILSKHPELKRFLYRITREVLEEKIQAWDVRWLLTILDKDGLVAIPKVNLVEHLETGTGATHVSSGSMSEKALEMNFPLKHPAEIKRNLEFDRQNARRVWDVLPFHERLIRRLKIWMGLHR